MRVLIVCSYNSGRISPFVLEQVGSLKGYNIAFDFFKITGKGGVGYLKNLNSLRDVIKEGNYDFIHAHYGFSGLLANLQRMIPVLTTYHGSDVHYLKNRIFSYLSSRLSVFNILTNQLQGDLLQLNQNFSVIPCGVDTELFRPVDKKNCREKLGFDMEEKIILFSSSFDRAVKNPELARMAIALTDNVRLVELKGYSREEVPVLINASDAVLITSHYETGPLIVKEALACNTPVISTDVGDVKGLIKDLDGCYIVDYDAKEISERISEVLSCGKRTEGREAVERFDLHQIAQKLINIYQSVAKV